MRHELVVGKCERLKLLLMVQLVWKLVGVIARGLDMLCRKHVIFCVPVVHNGNSDFVSLMLLVFVCLFLYALLCGALYIVG